MLRMKLFPNCKAKEIEPTKPSRISRTVQRECELPVKSATVLMNSEAEVLRAPKVSKIKGTKVAPAAEDRSA